MGRWDVAGVRRVLRGRQHHRRSAGRWPDGRPASVPGPRPRRSARGPARMGLGSGRPVYPGRRRAPRMPAQLRAADGIRSGRRGTRCPDGFRDRVGARGRRPGPVPAGVLRSGVRDDQDGRALRLLPRPDGGAHRRVGRGPPAAPGVRRRAVRGVDRTAGPGGCGRPRAAGPRDHSGGIPAARAGRFVRARGRGRVWSATASTCISRCTATATCWPAGPVPMA